MRNNLSKIVFTAVVALLLPIMFCYAAGNPSALVGRWVLTSDDENCVNKDCTMEFLSDGTGIVTMGSKGIAVTWKTEKDRFYMTAFGSATAYNYKLQGSLLKFTDNEGKIEEWTKCNIDCREIVKEYAKARAEKAAADAAEKAAATKTDLSKIKKISSSFTDSRDGKSYKTLKLGNQTWMAENLNYHVPDSKCYGEDGNVCNDRDCKKISDAEIKANCQKYGRLYNWGMAKKACPSGWHLPSQSEWQTLVDLAGGGGIAGSMLKTSSGWANNDNGLDVVGFSALPGGLGSRWDTFTFYYAGINGFWWSASENYSNYAYNLYVSQSIEYQSRDKILFFSVRCLQD